MGQKPEKSLANFLTNCKVPFEYHLPATSPLPHWRWFLVKCFNGIDRQIMGFWIDPVHVRYEIDLWNGFLLTLNLGRFSLDILLETNQVYWLNAEAASQRAITSGGGGLFPNYYSYSSNYYYCHNIRVAA